MRQKNSKMFNPENYQKDKLTIDIVKANIVGLLILIPTILVFALPYYFVWRNQFSSEAMLSFIKSFTFVSYLLFLAKYFLILIGGIILHELIHGITWAFYAKRGFKSIKFGVLWKMMTPYCHCSEPLKVYQYIVGGIMPAFLLGIIPSIIAIVIGNLGLLIFGIFFTMAASGDFMIINLLRKENPLDYTLDHPSEAGCYIFRRKSY